MIANLDIAYKMLSTFYQTAGDLYSSSIYTANMHSLEHLVSVVHLCSPIWAYSMFGFENLNGYLGSIVEKTPAPPPITSLFLQLAIQILV